MLPTKMTITGQPATGQIVESPMRLLPLLLAAALTPSQPGAVESPRPSAGHALVSAKALVGVLLLNGEAKVPAHIWVRKASTWVDLGPLGTTPRSLAACAYDPVRKMLVVHGGALPSANADGGNDWKVDGQTL